MLCQDFLPLDHSKTSSLTHTLTRSFTHAPTRFKDANNEITDSPSGFLTILSPQPGASSAPTHGAHHGDPQARPQGQGQSVADANEIDTGSELSPYQRVQQPAKGEQIDQDELAQGIHTEVHMRLRVHRDGSLL